MSMVKYKDFLTMEDIFTEIVGKFGAAKADLEKEFTIKRWLSYS